MKTEPQKEHHWLQRFVGEWIFEHEFAMKPGEAPMKSQGTEIVRSLGGLWILAEGQGETPDGEAAAMLMTLGYDPRTKRFVGTWVGSMMPHMWLYDGELDESETVLTLYTEGPSMTAGAAETAKYKDVIEIDSRGHRIMTSHVLGDDGQWSCFMTAHYRRRA